MRIFLEYILYVKMVPVICGTFCISLLQNIKIFKFTSQADLV